MADMQRHWDIFCRVIDNYGDIGICWRLARQLVSEHGKSVRLWVDDLGSLQALCPAVDPALAEQHRLGVDIRPWNDNPAVDTVGGVNIEAFACELPAAYVAAMAATQPAPLWINLEYLTAESWAEGCHGMASPHPSLPLIKHFFFPGFSPQSGGLLREKDLLARRDAAMADRPPGEALEISLFCYDTAPVGALLDSLAQSTQTVRCYVPPGQPLAAVTAHFGADGPWRYGALEVLPVPFMSQDDYDHLLWRCDINFVRGEDSFVRAQWAGKPFVWQIYRQEEEAHLVKLEAFLERYTATADDELKTALLAIFSAWNTGVDMAPAWAGFINRRAALSQHASAWSDAQAKMPDLAEKLVKFCASSV